MWGWAGPCAQGRGKAGHKDPAKVQPEHVTTPLPQGNSPETPAAQDAVSSPGQSLIPPSLSSLAISQSLQGQQD